MQRTCTLLAALAILATPALAAILRQEPPPGTLRQGERALVDDGTCPQGQIKEVTGGNQSHGIPRQSRCVAASAAANETDPLTPEALKAGIAMLRSRQHLDRVWFRLESPGQEPVEVTAGGAAEGETVGTGSISKSVTAIGIALLIQEGKLRLDSTLGDLLANYFAKRKTTLDPSLRPITIERLLTHRAGLRPNPSADPVHGLDSRTVSDRIGGTPHFFNYIIAAGEAKSNGKSDYVYSNLSYLILGMVIEAVSGKGYEEYSQEAVFHPLGITDASIPSYWNVVAPFGGWRLKLADIVKVWTVFDIGNPSLLSAETLKATLLGKLAAPIHKDRPVYYAMGAFVRQDREDGPYVIDHDGLSGFNRNAPTYWSYVEKFVPGYAWAISVLPAPPHPALAGDVRQMLSGRLGKK